MAIRCKLPWAAALLVAGALLGTMSNARAELKVDWAGYRADCGVEARRSGDDLRIGWDWPVEGRRERGELALDLRPGRPLIGSLGAAAGHSLEGADPVTFLLVGERAAPSDRPPGMSVFNVFFDSPARRPFQSYRSRLDKTRVGVASHGRSATIAVGDLELGPFRGELRFTVYAGAPLVHLETVVRIVGERRAVLYDTGLALSNPQNHKFAWMDVEGAFRQEAVVADAPRPDRALRVRNRALALESDQGAIACFPPPHQYFFPRDLTDNLGTVWFGTGHRGLDDRLGFGIRQVEKGGGAFSPWFNAPPGSVQRLGVFYLVSPGRATAALHEARRFTHDDRFVKLPGHRTLTSHWHMATAVAALAEAKRGGRRSTPDLVRVFKNMGVEIVHLAEFHGDGHPRGPDAVRLDEMRSMFEVCRRLSDEELLLLPGEEPNIALGLSEAGRRPGHWLYLFPKPVYWTMNRAPGQPFRETLAPFGTVYHVGDGADLQRLAARENGLLWTSHPRVKGSTWTPDLYRNEEFYKSERWLGAAWKALPADLSDDRLGRRALDLLDDMANWGQKKSMVGEADVFKIDHTHELYGHMNINYVRLGRDRLPRFDDGWPEVLDALRAGRFFVTTGEVLISEFTIGGRASGETLERASGPSSGPPTVRAVLRWTFPLDFVEVVSGDGARVYRDRIDCRDTEAFGQKTFRLAPDLKGRKWARLEAWDVARNGAFTQPVWLLDAANAR